MVTEIELKYSLLEGNKIRTTEDVKGSISQLLTKNNINFSYKKKQLSNHYFDTATLALRNQRIALRTRSTIRGKENQCFEQTIKTSGRVIAGLHQRPEYNVNLQNAIPILTLFPESLWQNNTDLTLLQNQITELFSTNFTRYTWLITLENAQVELAFDNGEIACQGYPNKPVIYEIELELVSGERESLFFLTKLLFTELALRPGQLTKAARGYALYNERQLLAYKKEKNVTTTLPLTIKNKQSDVRDVTVAPIFLSTNNTPSEAFKYGVDVSLTQLQLSIDDYVDKSSFDNLGKIRELLCLLKQGFLLFNEVLTKDALILSSELSYFIRSFHWVDNACYLQTLDPQLQDTKSSSNRKSSHQKEYLLTQRMINQLQANNNHLSEFDVVNLLHSERFNNLQLGLLSLLLDVDEQYIFESDNHQSLVEQAKEQLTSSNDLLTRQLSELTDKNSETPHLDKPYRKVHSLLESALLTNVWFSDLFCATNNILVKEFTIPKLAMIEELNELQALNLLEQHLTTLPDLQDKLEILLSEKHKSLLTALDKSRTNALSVKPYWYK